MHWGTIHPELVPLAEEWYDFMGMKKMKLKFDEVISLFDKHINDLPDEDDNLEELLRKAKRLYDRKEKDIPLGPSKQSKVVKASL
jgi:hypothetical protein